MIISRERIGEKICQIIQRLLHSCNPTEARKASRDLLPCEYKQYGISPKPDCPDITFDKINSHCITMAFVRCLYGCCDK